jgi:hypothetical protein
MADIILAHAPDAKTRAAALAAALQRAGYEVALQSPGDGRAGADLSEVKRYVLLWSTAATRLPALRIAARAAKAQGKLALARLDRAAPPPGLPPAINLSGWRGKDTRAWRAFLAALPAAGTSAAVKKRSAAPATAVAAPEVAAPKKGGGAALAWAAGALIVIAAAAAGGYLLLGG